MPGASSAGHTREEVSDEAMIKSKVPICLPLLRVFRLYTMTTQPPKRRRME
jgi:hypothetical protein